MGVPKVLAAALLWPLPLPWLRVRPLSPLLWPSLPLLDDPASLIVS